MQIQNPRHGYKTVQIQSGRHEEIPDNWQIVLLKEVITDINTGFASGERDEHGIVQLRMNNVSDTGTLEFAKLLKVPTPEDIDQYDLRKDDVLFNNTNSLDLIGKSAIITESLDYTFSNHITRIRADKTKLTPYFLLLLFLKYKKQAIFRSICNTHVGQSGIGKNELQRLKIILPPLKEQQKITSILSKVDDLIQKTDEIIEQIQRLKKGLMQKLFTKGIGHARFKKVETIFGQEESIPYEWDFVQLQDLAADRSAIRMGPFGSSLKKDELMESGEIKTIWIENIGQNEFDWTYRRYITAEKYEQLKGFAVKPDDVLLTMMGTYGKVALAPSDIGKAIISSHLLKITTNKEKCLPQFLYSYLMSNMVSRQLIRESRGIVMEGLNTGIVKSIMTVLPDIKEQAKIYSILSSVDNQIKSYQKYRKLAANLKNGLMHKLLTGQIRVKV